MSDMIKILSIDGGGIRGLIPALILAHIEQEVGQPICDIFDLIAGTSTGGIIALALVKPGDASTDTKLADERGAPQDAVNIYSNQGAQIFHGARMGDTLRTIRALFYDSKYSEQPIERALHDYFGDLRMRQALTPVIIPTYDIQNRTPRFFKSHKCEDMNVPMWHVARATSAAPTFFDSFNFDPGRITPIDTQEISAAVEEYERENPLEMLRRRFRRDCAEDEMLPKRPGTLVDGGVIANNPAMCAYAEMMKYGADYTGDKDARSRPMLMVSIGTGNVGRSYHYEEVKNWGQAHWAKNLLADMFTNGAVATVDYQLREIFKSRENNGSAYIRLEPYLGFMQTGMDDTSEENLNVLRDSANRVIYGLDHDSTQHVLDEMSTQLRADGKGKREIDEAVDYLQQLIDDTSTRTQELIKLLKGELVVSTPEEAKGGYVVSEQAPADG